MEDLELNYEAIHLDTTTDLTKVLPKQKNVFVYGSVKLARLAKVNTHWFPGSFYGGNHLFEVYAKHYQEYCLNYKAEVFSFGTAISWQEGEQKFIKPYQAAKVFTGNVFTKTKWTDFVAESLANPRTPLLHDKTLMQASIPQKILKET